MIERSAMTDTIRVLLVDDQAMLRDALAYRLDTEAEFEVVGVAEDAQAAIECAREAQPDLVLMDAASPGLSSFDGIRRMQEVGLDPAVVFTSVSSHDHFVAEAQRVGARGYLLKSEPVETLLEALRRVARGGTYFSESVSRRLVPERRGEAGRQTRFQSLSPRETQVLCYLADGHPKKTVAELMEISVKTVEGHAQHLMKKLDIHNRVELARYAIREGLVQA